MEYISRVILTKTSIFQIVLGQCSDANEPAPQTADNDMKFNLSDYERMLELKRDLFKNVGETVQIEWIERILHIFQLNIEIQDVLANALPPIEILSVANATEFLLPELGLMDELSMFTPSSIFYLNIFERSVRHRWQEVFREIVLKNHLTLFNDEFKKLLNVITDRKDKLSKTALIKINTALDTSFDATAKKIDEIRVKAMAIKKLTRIIFDDIVDINYYAHIMMLESKQNPNRNVNEQIEFFVKNKRALKVITISCDNLSIQAAHVFEKVREIDKILDFIVYGQKYLPHKIIELLSINDSK